MRNQPEYSKVEIQVKITKKKKLEIQKLFEEAINDIQFMPRSWCSKTSLEMRQVPFLMEEFL